MTKMNKTLIALGALLASGAALAAGADLGNTAKQATNWTAIAMFGIFVAFTLWITKWAAGKTKTAADFYTAGGGITGFQNGLAIAGDYMSAASFLGISGLVFLSQGLAFLLAFIGVKLLLHALHENEVPFINGGEPVKVPEIPTLLSLGVIVVTLATTAVVSLWWSARHPEAVEKNDGKH